MKYASQTFTRVSENLFKTEAGVYYGRLKKAGKVHKKKLSDDFVTAKRKLREFEAEVENKGTLSPDILFQHIAEEWLQSLRFKGLKASSLLRRETCVKGLQPQFGGLMLREIDQDALTAWAKRRVKEVVARTYNIDRETLIGIFNFAVAKKILHKNPVAVVKVGNEVQSGLEKRKDKKKTKITPPTREEFAQLVTLLDSHGKTRTSGKFVQFLAATGLRLTEARHVKWEDVDFRRGKIRITAGEVGTKNGEQRWIPLFPKAKELLESIKPSPSRLAPHRPIFDVVTAKQALISASTKMGKSEGEHFTHHDLRHYFASNAVEKGIDFKVIADWLGHKDGGILAANTYSHLRQSHSDELAALMV